MAAQPRFPHGMRNATTTYSLSIGTDLDAYKDLSDHHYMSTRNLVINSPDESYCNTDGEEYSNGRRTPRGTTLGCGIPTPLGGSSL
jgi:putative hemolysin